MSIAGDHWNKWGPHLHPLRLALRSPRRHGARPIEASPKHGWRMEMYGNVGSSPSTNCVKACFSGFQPSTNCKICKHSEGIWFCDQARKGWRTCFLTRGWRFQVALKQQSCGNSRLGGPRNWSCGNSWRWFSEIEINLNLFNSTALNR